MNDGIINECVYIHTIRKCIWTRKFLRRSEEVPEKFMPVHMAWGKDQGTGLLFCYIPFNTETLKSERDSGWIGAWLDPFIVSRFPGWALRDRLILRRIVNAAFGSPVITLSREVLCNQFIFFPGLCINHSAKKKPALLQFLTKFYCSPGRKKTLVELSLIIDVLSRGNSLITSWFSS